MRPSDSRLNGRGQVLKSENKKVEGGLKGSGHWRRIDGLQLVIFSFRWITWFRHSDNFPNSRMDTARNCKVKRLLECLSSEAYRHLTVNHSINLDDPDTGGYTNHCWTGLEGSPPHHPSVWNQEGLFCMIAMLVPVQEKIFQVVKHLPK